MTEMYPEQAQPATTSESWEAYAAAETATATPNVVAPAAGGRFATSPLTVDTGAAMVNEIAAIGHDLSTEEGIASANAAISSNVETIGHKVTELRRIMDARARMNSAYKQLNKATARSAPLDQVVPLLKELEELKDSGIPVFYPADQVTDMLTKAEEARIIIDEYLRILTAMEQHECCVKPND